MGNINVDEFNSALNDVRKAHRIIFEYQSRMLDLITFISSKLGFGVAIGEKLFSDPIKFKKGNAELKIFEDMWAWDFIYSYCFRYYFNYLELETGDFVALSIIQYSDTGFYENISENSQLDLKTFANTEDSTSKLLFILELKPKRIKEYFWNDKEISENKKYASGSFDKEIINNPKGNILLLYSFKLDRFINEKSTMEALEEFNTYCIENIDVDFL